MSWFVVVDEQSHFSVCEMLEDHQRTSMTVLRASAQMRRMHCRVACCPHSEYEQHRNQVYTYKSYSVPGGAHPRQDVALAWGGAPSHILCRPDVVRIHWLLDRGPIQTGQQKMGSGSPPASGEERVRPPHNIESAFRRHENEQNRKFTAISS